MGLIISKYREYVNLELKIETHYWRCSKEDDFLMFGFIVKNIKSNKIYLNFTYL